MGLLTRAEIRSLVYALLAESEQDQSNPKWPPSTVNIYIYKALCEVARRIDSEFFTQTRTIDASNQPIQVAADFLCDLQVFFGRSAQTRRRLVPEFATAMDSRIPDWRVSTGSGVEPTHFIVQNTGGTLSYTIWPAPQASVPNGIFEKYRALPADYAGDTETNAMFAHFPDFERTLVPYIVCRDLSVMERGEMADLLSRKFALLAEAEIARLTQSVHALTKPMPTARPSRW
ncbi:MAG: hypothetical protein N2111_13860 [Candidatus Sumerlaeaceae bacterium]|nr:hypothetical protein [Candidatus Sumerlaeaceae bacterium]